MKRLLAAILIAALCVTLCLTLTACDAPKVRVESVLNITTEFSGSRTVTVVYPLSAAIDSIKDDILDDDPTAEVEGATFSYLGATENGYSFELKLSFDSEAQYEQQVEAILGRDANAVLSQKDNAMFKGTRVAEDFDVSELIAFLVRETNTNDTTKDYTFEYPYNKVTVGAETFDTDTTVNVNEGDGIPVSAVDIKTYNEKTSLFGRTFDRSFVFSIPADTYSANKNKINAYFEELAGESAQISDTHEGDNILYTLVFEGLSLDELETTTGAILDSNSVSVYYGDKENLSTPLFEGRVLQESLDTLSFMGAKSDFPTLRYTYSLPTNAVKGEGALYENGAWVNTGSWEEGAYRMENSSGLTRLRIFDGRQYYIDGVDLDLQSHGDGTFRRTTSFLYPAKDGFEGPVYATKFYESKNTDAKYDNDGEHIVCSITFEGTSDEINEKLENVFGKGNYLSYEKRSGALSDKSALSDTVDLRDILSVENADVPMTYTASAENGENIVTMNTGGAESAYKGKDDTRLELSGGTATVGWRGVIPKAGSIILYIIFGIILIGVTGVVASRMLYQPIRRERRAAKQQASLDSTVIATLPESEPDPTPSYAPQQTTTFSIFELGALSRNKKYVEEINKDVESRMEADRLENRKKELRKKELEEMERRVYGGEEAPAETEPATDNELRTIEILDALNISDKPDPKPAETTDPMELLSLMDEEENDD